MVECVAPSRFVGLYEGVLLGKACSPGVVAIDGQFRSRWFDAPRQVLWLEEVIPGPPYRLLPCGGASSLHCRWPAAMGRARVCRVECGEAVSTVLPRVCMRVCSRFWILVAQGPGGFPTRRTRALRRALRISCTRAACAAQASVAVRMAGCSCSPSASARIWWIAKTGHTQWGFLPSARAGGWPPAAAMSLTILWCAASGAAPTARGSRGHGLGARCRLSPSRWPSGVRGLAVEQGAGAVRQGRGRGEHGVDGLQAPVDLLRVRGDPHLLVVAIFQHNHGDGAGVTLERRGRCACRLWVPPRHAREVTPPVAGCLAIPFCQGFVRWDAEGFGSRRWSGPLPAPGAGRGPGVCRRCYERLCPAQGWYPFPSLGRLEGVEPPDPRFNKVVRDLCPGGDERLELPHKDFGCCGVRQGDHGEEPVRVDVLQVLRNTNFGNSVGTALVST